ncbi:MAG: hypothetical protein ACI8P0_002242 [Planctomycetaceae bacterium]|jgi:hypothetical protein
MHYRAIIVSIADLTFETNPTIRPKSLSRVSPVSAVCLTRPTGTYSSPQGLGSSLAVFQLFQTFQKSGRLAPQALTARS